MTEQEHIDHEVQILLKQYGLDQPNLDPANDTKEESDPSEESPLNDSSQSLETENEGETRVLFSEQSVINLNCNRSKTPALELQKIAFDRKTEILCVQEPNKEKGKVTGFNEYKVIGHTEDPRALIVLNSDKAQMAKCEDFTERDIAVAYWYKMKGVLVCSVYREQDEDPKILTGKLERIHDHAKAKGYDMLVMGDFNAHSKMWGGYDTETNEKGDEIEDLCTRLNLDVANEEGVKTWRCLKKHDDEGNLLPPSQWKLMMDSTVDLTITTRRLSDCITNWTAKFETSSDHALVTVKMRLSKQKPTFTYKTDWFQFNRELRTKIFKYRKKITKNGVDMDTVQLTNVIIDLWKKNSKRIKMDPIKERAGARWMDLMKIRDICKEIETGIPTSRVDHETSLDIELKNGSPLSPASAKKAAKIEAEKEMTYENQIRSMHQRTYCDYIDHVVDPKRLAC
jgi:hypothetical protein